MDLKRKASQIVEILKKNYEASCSLQYTEGWQLLFATRLAAQCTDARVNKVTPILFKKFPTLQAFADAELDDIFNIVKPCGFYRMKGADLKNCAAMLISEFDSKLPDTIEQLIKLPGVGRKTANIIIGDYFNLPSIPADTHCIRITNRLGLVNSKDAVKVEMQLKEIIEPSEQTNFCHRIVNFGRDICTARSPKCSLCPLQKLCDAHLNK